MANKDICGSCEPFDSPIDSRDVLTESSKLPPPANTCKQCTHAVKNECGSVCVSQLNCRFLCANMVIDPFNGLSFEELQGP
jgi:hypothetical protein